jgi:hypothetical protein
MMRLEWRKVKRYLPEERKCVDLAKQNHGWKPRCAEDAPIYRWGLRH